MPELHTASKYRFWGNITGVLLQISISFILIKEENFPLLNELTSIGEICFTNISYGFWFLCLKITEWERKKKLKAYMIYIWVTDFLGCGSKHQAFKKTPTSPTLLCSRTSSCYLHSFWSAQTADIQWSYSQKASQGGKKNLWLTSQSKNANF